MARGYRSVRAAQSYRQANASIIQLKVVGRAEAEQHTAEFLAAHSVLERQL